MCGVHFSTGETGAHEEIVTIMGNLWCKVGYVTHKKHDSFKCNTDT